MGFCKWAFRSVCDGCFAVLPVVLCRLARRAQQRGRRSGSSVRQRTRQTRCACCLHQLAVALSRACIAETSLVQLQQAPRLASQMGDRSAAARLPQHSKAKANAACTHPHCCVTGGDPRARLGVGRRGAEAAAQRGAAAPQQQQPQLKRRRLAGLLQAK